MAKTIHTWIALCWIFIYAGDTHAETCIAHTYLSQLGVREATNHNDGVVVEQYLRSCHLGAGYAWCGAFVKWCLNQCGVDTKSINAWAGSTHRPDHLVWYHQRMVGAPRVGDVFCLWDQQVGRVCHTGFYHQRVNDAIYETVEGNTNDGGSAEGDGVYKRRRSLRATWSISRWIE